jgi:hypothetical protein
MKTFTNIAAQGDTLYRRIEKLPDGATPREKTNGEVVVAHSETGHHHLFRNGKGIEVFDTPNDPLVCYLRLESEEVLEHMRSFDTHESIKFSPGLYEVRRQREATPEGWRRVED